MFFGASLVEKMEAQKENRIRYYIKSCRWTWSKTMPLMPHEYIVRGRYLTDDQFVEFVQAIRTYGRREKWGRYNHEYLYIDGYKYWTMGSPIEQTRIINRAKVFNEYDGIAGIYDGLFTGNGYPDEDREVAGMIEWDNEPILDIGCGTGLLISLLNVPESLYMGIDPSGNMLARLKQKYPLHPVKQTPFEQMAIASPEYYAVALYGSPSYIIPQYLKGINQFKRHFLMFYKPDYYPVTYEKTGVKFAHYRHTEADLQIIFPKSKIIDFNNYLIVIK